MRHLTRISITSIFFLLSTYSHAQECTDTVPLNDGWGWNGSESCRTPQVDQTLTRCDIVPVNGTAACLDSFGNDFLPELRDCVDADGDGWGWNGLGSCRPNPNLVRNGTFDRGDADWNTFLHPDSVEVTMIPGFDANAPYASNFLFNDGHASFSYLRAGTQWWHSQLFSDPISLEGGRSYQLSFFASSTSGTGNAVGSVVVENGSDFTKYLTRQDFPVFVSSAYYFTEFTVPGSDDNARVTFNLGDNFGGNNSENIGTLVIDDVRLVTSSTGVDQPGVAGNCDSTSHNRSRGGEILRPSG